MNRLVCSAVAAALVGVTAIPRSAAEPPGVTANVGTAVEVLMHKAFEQTTDADQCVGAAPLAAVRRGSSVILSEGSASPDARKVAVGQFFRSRVNDGACQVLYITSAPVMPSFNVQFVGPLGELSAVYGPNPAEPVTDQPGIQQIVRVDMAFDHG